MLCAAGSKHASHEGDLVKGNWLAGCRLIHMLNQHAGKSSKGEMRQEGFGLLSLWMGKPLHKPAVQLQQARGGVCFKRE